MPPPPGLKTIPRESHNDDITCLKFHNDKKDVLATDGLGNVLDLLQLDEDEALVTIPLAMHTQTKRVSAVEHCGCWTHTVLDRSSICHGIRRSGHGGYVGHVGQCDSLGPV